MSTDVDRRRRWREAKRKQRARIYAAREADSMTYYRAQAANPTDAPLGVTLEQHRNWCRFVVSLPKLEDLAVKYGRGG